MRRFSIGMAAACRSALSSVKYCSSKSEKDALHAKLRGLINQDRLVVFLTGTPEEPRCRFTFAMSDMLRQLGVQYTYVNILSDDDVCEGLKEYSNWPTYPQVYLDGELLGGYDVCKKMLLDGELTKMLKDKGLL
jgi:Grx4 family monothiol glutaredoxin